VAGHLSPGVQTGFCADTGGGWSDELVAHRSQLHPVPDALPDRVAVLIEPLACAIHATRRAAYQGRQGAALVVGAGTLGLLTTFALRRFGGVEHIIVAARHPLQRELAREMGASSVVSPEEATGAIRRLVGTHRLDPPRGQPFLLDGVDLAFECAGTVSALELALRTTRAGGRVVLVGLPPAGADLAPLWFRELELVGAYGARGGFAPALEVAADAPLRNLLSAVYPLSGWRTAVDHALDGGRLGAVKIAFDLRDSRWDAPASF
jgi:threonine dehydrogenase-like Zn-dependent dehydrogenase